MQKKYSDFYFGFSDKERDEMLLGHVFVEYLKLRYLENSFFLSC